MNKTKYKFLSPYLVTLLFVCVLILTSCKTDGDSSGESQSLLDFSTGMDKAVASVDKANEYLKRIKILYTLNNKKFGEFKKALENKETEKVKKLANVLQYAINDGYVLAENAKDSISKAQEYDINDEYREYLQLKEASLDMQIKAFKFRKDSAKLFRNMFGTEDETQLKTAQATFKQNEKQFAEHMQKADKLSKQADTVAKEAMKNNK